MLKRSSTLVALILLMALPLACGSDDDGATEGGGTASCFWQCDATSSGCESGPHMSQSTCDSTAANECGATTPMEVVFQSGCSCPDFGDPGECQDAPSWY